MAVEQAVPEEVACSRLGSAAQVAAQCRYVDDLAMSARPKLRVIDRDHQPTIGIVFRNGAGSSARPARHIAWFSHRPDEDQVLAALQHIIDAGVVRHFCNTMVRLVMYHDDKQRWYMLDFYGYRDAPDALSNAFNAQGFDMEVHEVRDGWSPAGSPGVVIQTFILPL